MNPTMAVRKRLARSTGSPPGSRTEAVGGSWSPDRFGKSAGHALGLLLGLLDGADVEEGAFGQVVPLAVADLLERADRVLDLRVLAGLVGEDLGHEERL